MVVGLALINYIYPTVRDDEGPEGHAFIGLIWGSSCAASSCGRL